MKTAQKCPECGELHRIVVIGIRRMHCRKCDASLLMAGIVEIVDWDEVFAPDQECVIQHI